jgi:hypothetical protein
VQDVDVVRIVIFGNGFGSLVFVEDGVDGSELVSQVFVHFMLKRRWG